MAKNWLHNAWLVVLAVWEPIHRLIVAFRWPIAFVASIVGVAIVGFYWWEGSFKQHKTIEQVRVETVQKLSEEERKYLAVAIIRDAMVESEPERVQEGVAWAVLNFRKKYGVDIPTIVKNSLTMAPLNSRDHPLIPTVDVYVLYKEANKGQRTAAYAMADKIIEKGSAALSDKTLLCSTQYIRKPRDTFKPSKETVAAFENPAQFKETPKGNSENPGMARFFCPVK